MEEGALKVDFSKERGKGSLGTWGSMYEGTALAWEALCGRRSGLGVGMKDGQMWEPSWSWVPKKFLCDV